MIGPNAVSSSRTTTLATNAVMMKIAKTLMIMQVCAIAYGELRSTLPPEPIWTLSEATAPNVSSAKIRPVTQNTGDLSW
jgi:hypothetical protein